jgi:hypothetical protein
VDSRNSDDQEKKPDRDMNREKTDFSDSSINNEEPTRSLSAQSDELVYRFDIGKLVDIDSSSEAAYLFDISTEDEHRDVESEKPNDLVTTRESE